jgi:hypothetical protein
MGTKKQGVWTWVGLATTAALLYLPAHLRSVDTMDRLESQQHVVELHAQRIRALELQIEKTENDLKQVRPSGSAPQLIAKQATSSGPGKNVYVVYDWMSAGEAGLPVAFLFDPIYRADAGTTVSAQQAQTLEEALRNMP